MRLNDIVTCGTALSSIRKKKLPVSMGFIINKNYKTLSPSIEIYEEQRKALIEQYAARNEDGEIIQNDKGISIANVKEFTSAMNELLDTETEIQLDTLTMEQVEKCDDPRYDALTGEEMDVIQQFMM